MPDPRQDARAVREALELAERMVSRYGSGPTREQFITAIAAARRLESAQADLAAKVLEEREAHEAMQWFVNRVDAGEVRSVQTYRKFKEILRARTAADEKG